jgi:hypothetical protein
VRHQQHLQLEKIVEQKHDPGQAKKINQLLDRYQGWNERDDTITADPSLQPGRKLGKNERTVIAEFP